MGKLCDLHTHTTASDGSFRPEESVRHAKELGAEYLAITDHDTVAGLESAIAEGSRIGQKVIPGIEITSKIEGFEIHIVGLFIDYKQPAFAQSVEEFGKSRDRRNQKMVQALIDNGFNISWDDLAQFRGGILTKAHIGQILVDRGYAANVTDAMNTYLRKGGVAYIERETPTPGACIELIHSAGGLAIVAHTNQIDKNSRDNSVRLAQVLLDRGADGLETRYCEFDEDWNDRTEALARANRCLRSGGSDFHGTFKKGLEMLHGYGNLAVPAEFVDAMLQKLKH